MRRYMTIGKAIWNNSAGDDETEDDKAGWNWQYK